MDISALCSADAEAIETSPTPSSPVVSYPPESDAFASKKIDHRLHHIAASPASYRISSDSVEIGYPPASTVSLNCPLNTPSTPPLFVNSSLHQPDSSTIQHHGFRLSRPPPSFHSPQQYHEQQQQEQSLIPPASSSSSSSLSSGTITTPRSSSITAALEPVDISHLIGQCTTLCEELDRCRDRDCQSRSEIERQQLLDSAAKTAKNLLGSLDLLKQKQHTQTLGQRKRPFGAAIEDQDGQEAEYLALRRAVQPFQDCVRQKIKRRTKRSTAGQRCHSCHTTETPEWRRGPDGARTLCNACGLHYSKLLRKDALTIQSDRKLLLGGTAKINALPTARVNPQLIHYPIIQVQAKPTGSKTSDGVRFINSQISFPPQGVSIKSYSGGRARIDHADEYGTARILELNGDHQ